MGEGSTKQRGTETTGYLWKGEGWGGVHRVNKMVLQGFSGRKTGNLKEADLGWINGGSKDQDFRWGKI